MTILDFLLLVVVAAVCGTLGQILVGVSMGGCLVSAVVGWIGAFIGMWIARQFGLPEPLTVQAGGHTFPVVWSIIGSALLVAVLSFFARRRAF
jgi:uncharacterized membrane protein YeaQ/YmgE (transglycosylase-associated protein family)